MPKYEVGYILSSAISDDEVPKTVGEISDAVKNSGGRVIKEDLWGRKKLAYPIGRTRNGYYVFITADLPTESVKDVEHKLNTNDAVIRFLIVNLTEADRMIAKGEVVKVETMVERVQSKEVFTKVKKELPVNVNIDEEIEKAISSEEEKI